MSQRSGFYTAIAYEFLGTAVIVMAFNLQDHNPMVRVAAYLGMYIFAVNVSGGHFNPATTLAVFMTEKESRDKNLRYLIVVVII